MSKLITERYEYLSLTDAVQPISITTPWPGGYSPQLPTPPGVTPINLVGVQVTDQYIGYTTASAGGTYGLITVSGSFTTKTITVPKYANMRIYNTSVIRLAMIPSIAQYTVGTPPAVALPVGQISSFQHTMNGTFDGTVTQYVIYQTTSQVAPNVTPVGAPSAVTMNLQILYWNDIGGSAYFND